MKRPSLSSFLAAVLNASWYFVAAALVLTACLAAISPWLGMHGGRIDIPVSFEVDAGAVQVSAPGLGVDAAELQNVRGSMSFPPPSRASVGALLTFVAGMMAVVLWVLSQLIAVFRTLRDGRPFVPKNAVRIRRIGYAVILGEFGRAALVFSANSYAVTYFSATGLHFDARPDLSVGAIIHGLIILAIAEVFRVGTQLAEEQSLTI